LDQGGEGDQESFSQTIMFIPAFLLAISIAPPPLACINTTYSRADETEITDQLGHLIIGAFAHHGPDFYEAEVARCQRILLKKADDFDARNDLGAAFSKLEKWKLSLETFEENERRHPGRYETASNMGVMYKKREEFELAAQFIEKALKIKPGGHMGLGDYYLKMIRWKKIHKFELKNILI
ncbi:MAG: tetratricopeptide repeat protein, partial [Spirochaetales bacterium]|nr:tetratricopeptide repeat protein [Spirochaetales bacterium]